MSTRSGETFRLRGRMLIAASFIASFGICCLTAKALYDLREAAYSSVIAANANIVASLQSDIARNIELYDLSIQAAIDGILQPEVRSVSPKLRQMILFDRSSTARHVGPIQVLDDAGMVRLDSRREIALEQDLSARDFFRVHKYSGNVGLFVGQPPELGRELAVGLSRRVADEEGRFLGVVSGTLRTTYFDELFGRLTLTGTSSITITHLSGYIVSRRPFDSGFMEKTVSDTKAFEYIAKLQAGHFNSFARVDGQERLFTFHRVGTLPLVVTISTPLVEIFKQWSHNAALIGGLVLFLCLSTVFVACLAANELRKREDVERELKLLATTDGLTGLPNRRSFDATLSREWQRALREPKPLSLLMVDADHFKIYNDKHGHLAGDEALSALAICLANSIGGAPEISARYGGEEFAILLPNTSLEQAEAVAQTVHCNILKLNESIPGRKPIPTVSIGVACLFPTIEVSSSHLVRIADHALYIAKNEGRNRTEVAIESRMAKAQLATPVKMKLASSA